jgi:hypothetical protein
MRKVLHRRPAEGPAAHVQGTDTVSAGTTGET